MAKAYVETKNGVPTLMLDGKPFTGNVVTIASNRDGIPKINEPYFKRLGEAGVRLFFLICDTEFTKPEAYTFFKEEAEAILRAVPEAYIILRVGLQPNRTWTDAHPEAMIGWSDGEKRVTNLLTETYTAEIGMYSLHAKEWRQAAGDALMDFAEKVNREPFADRIIGYFPAAGSTSEWLPSGHLTIEKDQSAYYDTSDDFRTAFASYLTEKYGENAPEPDVPDNRDRYYILDFDREVAALKGGRIHHVGPTVPTNGTSDGAFADIEKNRKTVDFYMAWGEATADSILYFAGLLKDRFPDKITGVFYGYSRVVHQSGNFTGLGKLLRDPRLDFCAAPGDYENRKPGGWEPLRTPSDSYRLHNTLFFAEEDTRTQKENRYYRSAYSTYDEGDAVNVIKRNFGKNICGGNMNWWFDQLHGGGRFDSPGILKTLQRQAEITKEVMEKGRYKQNEIALIYDTESRIAASHNTSHQSVTLMKNFSLGRIGAPYDEYLLEDMGHENMPDYKLYVFAAAYMLDNAKREMIHKKLQKNGATALWLYGAGYINPDEKKKMDCENIRQLTGFSVQKRTDFVYDGFFKIRGEHAITRDLQENHVYGQSDIPMFSNQRLHTYEPRPYACPLFYTDDTAAEIFGRFCEGGDGAAGAKTYNGFTSIWCGAQFLQPDFIRSVAKFAGCHIYSMDGDVIYAGSGYLTVHAAECGEKTIYLPKKYTALEVYEEKLYGQEMDVLQLKMAEGETKMWRLS